MSGPMGLVIPGVLTTPGPTYAQNISDALGIIEEHTHVGGEGNPVPAAGLNIDADLTFGGFNGTHFRAVRFNSQGSPVSLPADVSCLYVSGGDLWYNNGSGAQLQLTVAGALNASLIGGFTSLAGSTGAATYNSGAGSFTFTSNTGVKATISAGPVIITDVAPGASYGITIKSHASLAAAFSLTLPTALPSSTSILSVDTSGQLAYGRPATLGSNVSSSCSSFSTSSTSDVTIANLTFGVTTKGGPLFFLLQPDQSGGAGFITTGSVANGNFTAKMKITGAATATFTYLFDAIGTTAFSFPPSSVQGVYAGAAGTYTLTVTVAAALGTTTVQAGNMVLVAYELY